MPISELMATVAMVSMVDNSKIMGHASGFFYTHGDKLFLITNRHVVLDEKQGFRPTSISLRLHADPKDITRNGDFSFPLYAGDQPMWREHPRYGQKADVVAIPVAKEEIQGRFFIKAFSQQNLVPDDVAVSIGDDVLVIGFPLGFHDRVHNLAIVRTATLASVYDVPFSGDPFVLIDGRLHSGTSGSPVVTKPTNMLRKKDGSISMLTGEGALFLLGIHSASLDIRGRDPSRDEPLGLNCVWWGKLIRTH